MSRSRKLFSKISWAALLIAVPPLYAPQLLAFPHRAETRIGTVRSERPLDPAVLTDVVRMVRTRLATTPLAGEEERRAIFLTDGGWRWLWLANVNSDSFAISRPLSTSVVVNRADPATGLVRRNLAVGGTRTLEGVLAHEFTHGLIRRQFGEVAAVQFPQWKVEGYCDYVAGESSLTPAQAADLELRGLDHPALVYFRGRQRVTSELARNGNSPSRLFTD